MSIDFSGFKGCAGFGTRFSISGEYQSKICTDGAWSINRFTNQLALLAQGVVASASTYTIEAISDGSNQRLSINGIEVGSVSDSILSSDQLALELYNISSAKASAIFRNFVLTPLPTLQPTSPQITYRAPIPGAPCDKGGAQWALMTPLEAQIACQPNGMLLQVTGRNLGLEGLLRLAASFHRITKYLYK